jgi:phage FluMu protein Com
MTPTEFRCENCNKLLATFGGELKFGDSKGDDRTCIIEGAGQYLEIKCPRCKTINKKEMVGVIVFGKETHGDVTIHMPKSQVCGGGSNRVL